MMSIVIISSCQETSNSDEYCNIRHVKNATAYNQHERNEIFVVEDSKDSLSTNDIKKIEEFVCAYIDTLHLGLYEKFTITVLKETETTVGAETINLWTNSSSDYVYYRTYSWNNGVFFNIGDGDGVTISFDFKCKQ